MGHAALRHRARLPGGRRRRSHRRARGEGSRAGRRAADRLRLPLPPLPRARRAPLRAAGPARLMGTTLKLTLEYDGTGFRAWARQAGERTVEGVLRDALVGVFPRWDRLAVAGRTDAGVHATGQVASFAVEGGPEPARA